MISTRVIVALTVLFAVASAQTCQFYTCNPADCPNGCNDCASRTAVPISSENQTVICPTTTFCFIGELDSNNTCSLEICTACSGNTSDTCTGCSTNELQSIGGTYTPNYCNSTMCVSLNFTGNGSTDLNALAALLRKNGMILKGAALAAGTLIATLLL